MKYKILKKIVNPGFDNWLTGLTVGMEYGTGIRNTPHVHMVLTTKEKYNFQKIKEILKEQYNIIPNDIQAVKHLKSTLTYITKEDERSGSFGHDKGHLSLKVQAYLAAYKTNKMKWKDLPSNMPVWRKNDFMKIYKDFVSENKEDDRFRRVENIVLRPWQKSIRAKLLRQNDRQIMWIYDKDGNTGKSVLGKYLRAYDKAFYIRNGKKNNIAYLYNEEPIVVLDFARTRESFVSTELIETIKDGECFSEKYACETKETDPVKLLILANFLPKFEALSLDRWIVYEVWNEGQKQKLKLLDVNHFIQSECEKNCRCHACRIK